MESRPFFAARLEDRLNQVLNRFLLCRGWRECITSYTDSGTTRQVRVLARVVLRPPEDAGITQTTTDLLHRRGWHNFIAATKVTPRAEIAVGDPRVPVQTDRDGYIDVRIHDYGLPVGWRQVLIEGADRVSNWAPIHVIDENQTFGIVSDIDDTILSTWFPRPMVTVWNSLIPIEQAR